MSIKSLFVVILAAGKGTRMKSKKAKVLHEICNAPMIVHVIEAVLALKPKKNILVVGHQQQQVIKAVKNYDVEFAIQEDQRGTGHAVLCTESQLIDFDENGIVLILCGDTPLIRPATLLEMYRTHVENQNNITLMTTQLEDPTNYGRIIGDFNGNILEIVEEKDCSTNQLLIQEINAGIYLVDKSFLFQTLKQVGTDNKQGEFYLTDIIKIAVNNNLQVRKFTTANSEEILGVNSRIELAEADKELKLRYNRTLMLQGVSMLHPETISIAPQTNIGQDSILGPMVTVGRGCIIGESCFIGQGTVLVNCKIGNNVTIGPNCYLENQTIGNGHTVKPMSNMT